MLCGWHSVIEGPYHPVYKATIKTRDHSPTLREEKARVIHSAGPSLLHHLNTLITTTTVLIMLPTKMSATDTTDSSTSVLAIAVAHASALNSRMCINSALACDFAGAGGADSTFATFPTRSGLDNILAAKAPGYHCRGLTKNTSCPYSATDRAVATSSLATNDFAPHAI